MKMRLKLTFTSRCKVSQKNKKIFFCENNYIFARNILNQLI